MRYDNYCIVTGMLAQKDRNADSVDIKRPLLDIEIVSMHGESCEFERVSVLISDVMLTRAIPGLVVGELLEITGELRANKDGEVYIEAESIARLDPKSGKIRSLSAARSDLLQFPQRRNIAQVVGVSNQDDTVTVRRGRYSRGDIHGNDRIPVYFYNGASLPKQRSIVCMGEIGAESGALSLCITDAHVIMEEKMEEQE